MPENYQRKAWLNVGGQLITEENVLEVRKNIHAKTINSWDDLHAEYQKSGEQYAYEKLLHALASLEEIKGIRLSAMNKKALVSLLNELLATRLWIVDEIEASRRKDYSNPFRKMMYDNQSEMDKVVGKFADNSFVKQQRSAFEAFTAEMETLKSLLG